MVVTSLAWIGKNWNRSYLGQIGALWGRCMVCFITPEGDYRQRWQQLMQQIRFTGIEAVPLVILIALVLGTAVILQAATVMPKIGAGDYFGEVMVVVVVREMGPLFTAFLVAGRTGSALSTWIGNMKVQQEIDALRAMGIDPVRYLLHPAFTATLISLFCLTQLFNFIAIFGGYCVVQFLGLFGPDTWELRLSFWQYLDRVVGSMAVMDSIGSLLKPLVFGSLIALLAGYQGLNAKPDFREIPKATTRGVVQSFAAIILIDALFALPYLMAMDFL